MQGCWLRRIWRGFRCYDNVEWCGPYCETDALGGKDPYSASKGGAELVVKTDANSFFDSSQDRIKVAVGRAGNVIGGGDWAKDRIVVNCMRAWSQNRSVDIRSPFSTRPWQHVLEPLSAYLVLGLRLFGVVRHEITQTAEAEMLFRCRAYSLVNVVPKNRGIPISKGGNIRSTTNEHHRFA